MANVPVKRLEDFVMKLLDIENIRDIRLATKGLMGIPQHFLQDDVRAAFGRMGAKAFERGVDIALHTHVNCAQQVTPLVGDAAKMVLEAGFRDVRNQGVLLRGVNTAPNDLLELCFMLLDHAKIMPVLLLHVRHDPQRRALADVGRARRRTSSTSSSATCRGSRRRASCATCRSSASAGSTC